MFSYTDVPAFAAKYHQGDRTAAVEALIRNGPNVKYVPNNSYADAKLIIAWWTAALARRLPSGMAVYAVSPGAATATQVSRQASLAVKYLFIPIANLIPGMNQTPETAARRYLQASEFGTDVSGQFFASAQGKFSGPTYRPSSTDCRLAPRQPAKPQRADCYCRRGTCQRGRTLFHLHRRASLRGQILPG